MEGYLAPVYSSDRKTLTYTVTQVWQADVVWLDNSNLYTTRPEGLSGDYTLYRYTSGSPMSTATAIDGSVMTVTGLDSDTWTISLEDVPAYDGSGQPYIYYVVQSDSLSIDTEAGEYGFVYENVDNYTTYTTALFHEGTVTNVLANTTTFEVYKIWEDDEAEDRPDCTLHLYRVIEDESGLTNAETIRLANPVQGNDSLPVGKETTNTITFGTETELPLYDNQGHRYVYFALETGTTGDYHMVVDNSGSTATADLIAVFDTITRDDGHVKYILDGGTLTNDREAQQELTVTKRFNATAMQTMTDVGVKMQLQYYDKETGCWVNAGAADLADYDAEDTSLTVTDTSVIREITDFSAEQPELTAAGPTVETYDTETGALQEWRWIEIAVKANGSGYVDIVSSEAADGSITYEEAVLNRVAPGVGSDRTTAIYQPVQEDDQTISNTLVGDRKIMITKTWYDENGNNISADLADVSITFNISRSDGVSTAAGTLLDNDGNAVTSPTLTVDDFSDGCWLSVTDELPRYDEDGAEYAYTVEESSIIDPEGRSWSVDFTVNNSVIQDDDGYYIVQTRADYVNSLGPGETLTFDVSKQWLDGGDVLSREAVNFVVFYSADDFATTQMVAAGQLTDANGWQQRVHVTPIEEDTDMDHYVVIERSVLSSSVSYSEAYSAAQAPSVSYDYENRIGSIEDKAGLLEYQYYVYIERTATGERYASYRLTNQKHAKLSMELVKTWTVGEADAPSATFAFYRDGEQISLADLSITGAVVSADGMTFTLGENADDLTEDGNGRYQAQVVISGLDKYDLNGRQYEYSLQETAIGGETVTDGKAEVDGDAYISSVTLDEDKTLIVGRDRHHDGDIYYWDGENTRSDSFNLSANKVWRDDGTDLNDEMRPDVAFNVYRVSLQEDENLAALVEAGDTEALAAALSAYVDSAHLLNGDRFWNTKLNNWYWTCDLGTVARYDEDGYAYVYFYKEVYTGSAGKYVTAYSNLTCENGDYLPVENPGGDFTTKEVYGVSAGDLDDASSVCILADGIHSNGGDIGSYYSGTTVNYRQATRYLSGRKLWKMPTGWTLAADQRPEITIQLYRFTTPLTDESGNIADSYTQSEVLAKAASDESATLINMTALADGKTNFTFRLDTEGNALQKYDEFGRSYYYYICEKETLNAYPADQMVITASDFTITNTYDLTVDPRVSLSLTKKWSSNVAGEEAITDAAFTLYAQQQDADGKAIGSKVKMAEATLSRDEDGVVTYTFEDLPYYGPNERPLIYTLTESSNDGYVIQVDGKTGSSYTYTLTKQTDGSYAAAAQPTFENIFTGGSTSVSVSKVWSDDSNRDGLRPTEISIDLYADKGTEDEYLAGTATVSASDNWAHTFTGLRKYHSDGSLIVYTVTEDPVSNYTTSVTKNSAYSFTVTNTHTPARIDVPVTKVWADNSDQDGLRLESISVTLYADKGTAYEQQLETITLSAPTSTTTGTTTGTAAAGAAQDSNTWTGTFTNLLKYRNGGTEIVYTVTESAVTGYTAAMTTDSNGNPVITNTYTPATVDVIGDKTWDDDSDRDGKRPSEIKLTVYADKGTDFEKSYEVTVTVKDTKTASVWSYKLTNLPKYRDHGTEIVYTVEEQAIEGKDYAVTISTPSKTTDGAIVVNITNSLGNELINIPVTKVWDDANDQDGLRPESISVTLYADKGTAYEQQLETITLSAPTGTTTGTTAGTTTGTSAAGAADGNTWSGVFTNHLKYRDHGTAIVYTVEESAITGYTAAITGDQTGYTITNSHTPATTSVSGSKLWEDDHDRDGLRPEEITLTIYADKGTDYEQTYELTVKAPETTEGSTGTEEGGLTADDIWTYVKDGLPKYRDHGIEIVYTIEETAIDGYDTEIGEAGQTEKGDPTYDITNTHEIELMDIPVTKTWDDAEDRDGLRPETITLTLYADKDTEDEAELEIITLGADGIVTEDQEGTDGDGTTVAGTEGNDGDGTEDGDANSWSAVFTGYPKYRDHGTEIVYTVEEAEVPGYATDISYVYASTYPDAADDGLREVTIVNTHEPALTALSGTKCWEDDDDRDGIRPDQLTITLLADGEAADTLTITAEDAADDDANTWAFAFTDLPKYRDQGTEVIYTVEEESIDGYESEIVLTHESDEDGRIYTITNSHEIECADITVTHIWKDDDDGAGIRPETVHVHLYADGVEIGEADISADTDWTHIFENLPKYRDGGTEIVYTITEDPVDGYTMEIKGTEVTLVHDETETTAAGSTGSKPKTGDEAQPILWLIMMAAAAAAAALLIRRRRRA